MWKSIFALFALIFSIEVSEAVRCWKCDNALTNDDCLNRGSSVECSGESGGCFAEIRYHWGLIPPIRITKRCKQGLACDNNVFQNDEGSRPFQCLPNIPESICRCCCETEDCNKPDLGCLPAYPDCRNLNVPRNGEMDCKYGTLPPGIGETCTFQCNEGYKLQGAPVLVCGPQGNGADWSDKEPVCRPLRCNPAYTSLLNGQVDCTRRNFVGSVCSFQCDDGYTMDGHPTATCYTSQNWDHQPPKCIPVTCPPPMIPPTFGTVVCSNGNRGGSVCDFFCDNGYQLLGSPSSTCVDDDNGDQFGRWTNPVPKCGKIVCRPQSSNPTNGQVTCTNANNGGSVCTYKCNGKYSVVGSPSRTCEDDGDGDEIGRWSDREPTCQKIKCKPPRFSPQNGQVTCSDQNFVGSLCTYTCDDGYQVDPPDARETKCEDDGDGDANGQWSQPPPICRPRECLPVLSNPTHGRVSCSDGNSVRSVCRFTCDEGYYMRSAGGTIYPIATTDVICRMDSTWSQQPPTCEPIKCIPEHKDTDTKIVTCTDINNWRSVCTFECRDGSPISGQTQSECLDNGGSQYGKWSPADPVNTCNAVICQPPQIAPQNGAVQCTDGNRVFSVCTFSCNPGFYMLTADSQPIRLGQHDIDCGQDGSWSEPPPVCRPVVCLPKHANPEHGFVSCTRDNRYGSICSFRCIAGYDLVGEPRSECLDSAPGDELGDWSDPAPICQPAACTPPLIRPDNGKMGCSDGANFNSICSFTCDEGYYMLSPGGDAVSANRWESLCRADGTWTEVEPTCEPIYCLPDQTPPRHGDVSCTNGNNYRSTCTFTCNPGYQLSKPRATTDCLDDGNGDALGYWSDPPPECLPRACSPAQRAPANGEVSCTDGANFGSICTFRCDKGFYQTTADGDIVRSNDLKTECLSSNDWSKPPAQCRPISCKPPHGPPDNGRVTCSNANFYQSTCTFKCDPGYEVQGAPKSTCEDDGNGDEDGEWSSPAPICVETNCNPPLTDPNNGRVSCSNRNVFGSRCEFSCNEGFYMVAGSRPYPSNDLVSTCGAGRKWSRPPPTCRPITCVPMHRRPANGEMQCSNKNYYNSECIFGCDPGYVLTPGRGGSPLPEGESTISSLCGEDDTPGDANGAWTEPTPTCQPDVCEVLSAPENGRISCSNGNILGSVCTYVCNRGYFMRGPDTTVMRRNQLKTRCRTDLSWSEDPPTCEPITCLPVQTDPVSGTVTCTNENFHRSVCSFSCDFGYKMIGRPKTTCEEADGNKEFGEWSHPAPICKENLCDENLPLTPENGRKSCTNENVLGSVCTFTCDRYHSRIGPPRSTCVETPAGLRWSHESPICEPDLCQPPRETIRNGVVTCTRENFVTSVCTYKCTTPGYSLYPATVTSNRCLPSKRWDRDEPCCTRPCPPNARMDAFVLLDSSSSVGAENWVIMKEFVRGILASFTISEDTTHFSVVRYNAEIDTDTQILLRDYPNDKAGLLRAFDILPYNGRGTRTGQAIKYVGDVLMTEASGNRPDVQDILIVVTDGKSQDDVYTPSEALRRRGVLIFAVGIEPPRGKLDMTQLEEIAGSKAGVMVARGFTDLDSAFALRITDKVCGHPCDQA